MTIIPNFQQQISSTKHKPINDLKTRMEAYFLFQDSLKKGAMEELKLIDAGDGTAGNSVIEAGELAAYIKDEKKAKKLIPGLMKERKITEDKARKFLADSLALYESMQPGEFLFDFKGKTEINFTPPASQLTARKE